MQDDLSLKKIIERADSLHASALNLTLIMPMKRLMAATLELQNYIKTLQVIAHHVAQVSNFITRLIHRKTNEVPVVINLIPQPGDYALLKILHNVTWNIPREILIVSVDIAEDIPISYLYQIKQDDKLAININGYVIDGRPGRIGYGLPQSIMCKYDKTCKTKCCYWHETDTIRNYTPDAWKTTSCRSKAGNQRLTGSIDTLNYDIQMLTSDELKAEIALRKSQLIHDIYIYQMLQKAIKK